MVDSNPFLRCTCSIETGQRKFNTCYTAGVSLLRAGQRISIRIVYEDTLISMTNHTTFLGSVRLGEAPSAGQNWLLHQSHQASAERISPVKPVKSRTVFLSCSIWRSWIDGIFFSFLDLFERSPWVTVVHFNGINQRHVRLPVTLSLCRGLPDEPSVFIRQKNIIFIVATLCQRQRQDRQRLSV